MPRPRPYDLRHLHVLKGLEIAEQMLPGEDAPAEKTATQAKRTIVCVHGILSNHAASFDDFFKLLIADSRFNQWDLCYFDYDYHQPMEENGIALADILCAHFTKLDEVVLVCHSMGGLVARFAILSRPMPFISKLFLLGTPNLGAFRTQRLSLLSQLTLAGTRQVHALFIRKTGILDLTRVPHLFKKYENSFANAEHINYISIPGLYFGPDDPTLHVGKGRWSVLFGGLNLTTVALSEFTQIAAAIEAPHDGIVEESSNSMIPPSSGLPLTEKTVQIANVDRFQGKRTYCHVIHTQACRELTHVAIQHDPRIVELVSDIVLAGDIEQWYRTLRRSLTVKVNFG